MPIGTAKHTNARHVCVVYVVRMIENVYLCIMSFAIEVYSYSLSITHFQKTYTHIYTCICIHTHMERER